MSPKRRRILSSVEQNGGACYFETDQSDAGFSAVNGSSSNVFSNVTQPSDKRNETVAEGMHPGVLVYQNARPILPPFSEEYYFDTDSSRNRPDLSAAGNIQVYFSVLDNF